MRADAVVDPHPLQTRYMERKPRERPWWWACAYPERPPDGGCCWLWECDACMMHLIAAATTLDGPVFPFRLNEGDGGSMTLAEALADARRYRAEDGLRAL